MAKNSHSKAAAGGFLWSAFSQVVRLSSQLVGVIVLARLLPPTDFGLVAMASVVTGLAFLFRDFGTTAAVIQQKTLTPALVDSVFWFNVIVGIVVGAILILLSPLVAWFFSESRLREVLCALALSFPIGAAGLVQKALMERVSNFKPLALIESSAALLGLGSAIAAAMAEWGVYSLVVQTLVSTIATSGSLWFTSTWRPGREGSVNAIRNLWGFSGNLLGFHIFNYFARNADNMLIGRVLGSTELGYYTMAYRLMLWPLQNISSVVGRVLLPVFSRMQTEPQRLAAAYVRTTAAITLVCAPLLFGLFVLREPFVRSLLGPKWLPVSDLLAWLTPVGMIQSMVSPLGSLYVATGRTDLFFRWGVLAGSVTVLSFAIGLQWGLRGLVISYALSAVILFIPAFIVPFRLVGLRLVDVARKLLPSVAAASAMAVTIQLIGELWLGSNVVQTFHLCALVALGATTYGLLSYIFNRDLLREIVRTFKGTRERL